jgi:hypothetical protein
MKRNLIKKKKIMKIKMKIKMRIKIKMKMRIIKYLGKLIKKEK